MNRKANPWVSLVALMLLVVVLVSICAGCCTANAEEPGSVGMGRFTVDSRQSTRAGNLYVITDTETGVQYLSVGSGYGIGVTKLEG